MSDILREIREVKIAISRFASGDYRNITTHSIGPESDGHYGSYPTPTHTYKQDKGIFNGDYFILDGELENGKVSFVLYIKNQPMPHFNFNGLAIFPEQWENGFMVQLVRYDNTTFHELVNLIVDGLRYGQLIDENTYILNIVNSKGTL
jgi:hypothetical protein